MPEMDNLLLTSKDADITLVNSTDESWSLWFFETPVDGKCLSVEYVPANLPPFVVQVQDVADAAKNIADVMHCHSNWERVESGLIYLTQIPKVVE